MNITDIKIKKFDDDLGKLKGYASVTIDDSLVLTNIAIVEGQYGLFIAMPSKKGSDGEYREIYYPLNKEVRKRLNKEILEVFNGNFEEIPKEDMTEF